MKYLCLIYTTPESGPQDDGGFEEMMGDYDALNDDLEAAGRLIAAESVEVRPVLELPGRR